MVSFRRLIVSKLWTIRRGKWLEILLAVLVVIGVCKIVLQDVIQVFMESPGAGDGSANLHHVREKGLNQKNYKLAWLGRDDIYLNENRGPKGKHRVRHKDGSNELSRADDQADQNMSVYTKRKFIFAFRYYEQLGRATSNLLALASWAKYRDSLVVAPFVNNSRMSGLPSGVSHFLRATTTMRFGTLDEYYNVPKLNQNLRKHGYGTLASFVDFENECHHRLNIVVHFLYSDPDSLKDAAEWYRKTYKEMSDIYSKAKANHGWLACDFVRHSRLQKQIRFKVSRYVCVDPDIIRSPQDLEEKVLQGRQCVGVVLWKGSGKSRTHFPLVSSITHPLSPSDVDFNPTLVKIAQDFVREEIGSDFIAIHVRIERHYLRLGLNITYRCMRKLIHRIKEARRRLQIDKVFLASDLPVYGSDTFKSQDSLLKDREVLLNFLMKELDFPMTYNPVQIYDTGSIAIVEMNILAAGKKIYTLGGGNFQEWILNLFRQKQGRKTRNIHRLCELT